MSSVPATDPSYCDLDAVAKGDWAVVIIMLVFTTSLVLLRMYARLIRMKAFGWDDAMLLVAYALSTAHAGFSFNILTHGFGRHEECVTHARGIEIIEWSTISQFLGIYSELFSRLSTAILILRIFGVKKLTRSLVIGYALVQTLILGITGILVWVQCSPTRAIWDSKIPHTCWSDNGRQALADTNGVFSVIGDLIVIVIPLHFMWFLQVPKALKIIVMSLFAVSLTPSACAVARMILHYTLVSPDFDYQEPALDLVFNLEVSMLVVCASLPTVPSLFRDKARTTGASGYNKPLAASRSGLSYPATASHNSTKLTDRDSHSLDNLSQTESAENHEPTAKATLLWTSDGFAFE